MMTTTHTTHVMSLIQNRTAEIGIIGLGYVGLPLAMLYSRAQFTVLGFDLDQTKVQTLNSGGSYIKRILPEEIQQLLANRFCATADYVRVRDMDAIIICVPTPLDEHQGPDMRYIEDTARAMAPYLREGHLVLLESTTYPGTTEEVLIPLLEAGCPQGLKCYRGGDDQSGCFHVAYSPEREDPGNSTVERKDIPKVLQEGAMAVTNAAK